MAKTKYSNELVIKGRKLASQGLMDKDIYANLGISKDSFYKYISEFNDFSEALKKGREEAKKKLRPLVENSLINIALGYSYEEITEEIKVSNRGTIRTVKTTTKHYPPQMGAIAYWLNNRAKEDWKNRLPIEPHHENFELNIKLGDA